MVRFPHKRPFFSQFVEKVKERERVILRERERNLLAAEFHVDPRGERERDVGMEGGWETGREGERER
jgi:hypothetical protein